MENASKALLIAGGVLLAIIILSVLVLSITKISDFNKSKEESIETEQVLKFNREYEAYNKSTLLGTEVITVWNKAKDNNQRKDSNRITYQVKVVIWLNSSEGGLMCINNIDNDIEPYFLEIKGDRKLEIIGKEFNCSFVGYSEDGRVNHIEFTDMKMA